MNAGEVEIVNTQEPTISTIVIICIIFLLGILLLIGSNIKSWTFMENNKNLLRFLGFGFLLSGAVILFIESFQLRNNLVALAVVFASIFSAVSLNETSKLRKENYTIRKQERLDKGLSVINDWLIQVVEHISILSRFIENDTELKRKIMDCRADLMNDVASSINTLAISNEIVSNPLVSDTDKEDLRTATTNVDKAVRDYNSLLFSLNLDTITEESAKDVVESVGDLSSQIRQMLEITARISFKLSS